ncbi:MAG: tRNA(His) guanylyltransferase Thg1 family protein [Methanomicrobiales archaeon]
MNECEIFSKLRVPCGSKIVIRVDGRNFSQLSRILKFNKPYDNDFAKIMVKTALEFCKEFSPSFIYTFSDEINILLADIPFSGRIEKLNSVFSSFISGAFTRSLFEHFFSTISDEALFDKFSPLKPISFDSRVIPLSKTHVLEYFKNRQNEAWRNCLNGYAYWNLREDHTKEKAIEFLEGKKSKDLHDILFKRGINIAEVPSWQRRGVGIYKKEIEVEGYNPQTQKKVKSIRRKVFIDRNLPLFEEEFFKSLKI